ncbi:MAG: endo alpha-1,4 polygalactosaminidase [bacterium]|nr:endo alpha-1,4 polygalactosaminidase [bacterium]
MKLRSLVLLFALVACGGGASGTAASPPAAVPTSPTTTPTSAPAWVPSTSDSFQWILSTALDTSSGATIYDLDAFSASSADVALLHGLGKHVVCYIDVGSWENFRPDASAFPASVIGKQYAGYPNENWLDIRQISLLAPIMTARFDLCKSKGFDAVEPDNVDGYQNDTGFPLTANDQLAYNAWIASLAHARALSVALKNDADQLAQLLPDFDFGLEESCWAQGSCGLLAPMRAAGKAVFTVEYTDATSAATFTNTYCPAAKRAGFYALLKHPALDAYVLACP